MPTRCRMPPEKSRTLRPACSVRSTAASQRSTSARRSRGSLRPCSRAQWSRNCSTVKSGPLPEGSTALYRARRTFGGYVEQIHRAALRGAQLTRQLLAFSRRREIQAQAVDLVRLLADLDVMLERLIGEDIEVIRQVEAQLGTVWGDPGELHQVILNLVVNACDAMPSGGSLTLALRHLDAEQKIAVEGGRLPPGPYVLLEVADTGMGMSDEVRRRIFEPFFTTKEPGKGTGLGLSTVHAIVRRSKGGESQRRGVGSHGRVLAGRQDLRPAASES